MPSGGVARPELDIVVVVPPSGLLRVLVTRLHVEGVVRGPFLRAEGNIYTHKQVNSPKMRNNQRNYLAYLSEHLNHLFLCRGEHGDDGEADGLHGERRAPVLGEDGETDVAVAVDVGVRGNVVADEDDLGRVEGVLRAELEAQAEPLALVQGVGRPVQSDPPPEEGLGSPEDNLGNSKSSYPFHYSHCEILPLQGVLVHADALRGILHHGHEFLL